MNGKHIVLEEGDFLPELGDVCMFYATVWEDGTLRVLGKNGSIKLVGSELTAKEMQKKSAAQVQQALQSDLNSAEAVPIYQTLVAACENEIPYKGERFTAAVEWLEPSTP